MLPPREPDGPKTSLKLNGYARTIVDVKASGEVQAHISEANQYTMLDRRCAKEGV